MHARNTKVRFSDKYTLESFEALDEINPRNCAYENKQTRFRRQTGAVDRDRDVTVTVTVTYVRVRHTILLMSFLYRTDIIIYIIIIISLCLWTWCLIRPVVT